MRPSRLLAPLAATCLTLGCGKKDPAQTPAPTAPAPVAVADVAPPSPDAAPTPEAKADTVVPTADTAAAPPAPTTCQLENAVTLGTAGKALPDRLAVIRHAARKDLPDLAAAEQFLKDSYSVFLDSPEVMVTYIEKDVTDPVVNLYVKAGDGFVAFEQFYDMLEAHVGVKTAKAGERYLVVSLEEEFHERVPACLNDEVDEEDCEGTATGDAGGLFTHFVVDLAEKTLAFAFSYGRESDEGCDKGRAPTLADGRWSGTDCGGKTESFALSDLPPCTIEAREKRGAAKLAEEERERERREKEAEAKRKPAAEVEKMVNEGRKLTKDKQYDEAIATFDKVLETNPDTLLAQTGRAYALLMRGSEADLVAAETQFDSAYQLTKMANERDEKVRAQIMFNRGLIAEKRGMADQARRFFQKAHDLSPSDATKKKLGL